MFKDVVNQALPGIETILAALATWALACAANFIRAHAKNATTAGIMTRLVDLTSVVVAEANQTLVDKVKNSDGLTPELGRSIRDGVLAKLKAHLGPAGIAELEKVFQPAQIEALLVSQIEAEVAKQKNFGPSDVPPPIAVVPAVPS